jgi:hypothetical protein
MEWMRKAAAQGFEPAQKALAEVQAEQAAAGASTPNSGDAKPIRFKYNDCKDNSFLQLFSCKDCAHLFDIMADYGLRYTDKHMRHYTKNDVYIIYDKYLQCNTEQEDSVKLSNRFIEIANFHIQAAKQVAELQEEHAETQRRQQEAQKQQQEADKTFLTENTERALALLKNSYLREYPQAQGHKTVQQTFEEFFERPIWEIEHSGTGGWLVVFNGIAKLGDQRARFTWRFSITAQDVREGRIQYLRPNLSVNNNWVSWPETNNVLADIFLN